MLVLKVGAINDIFPIDFNKQQMNPITLKEKQGIEFLDPVGGTLILKKINENDVIFNVYLDSNKFWGDITVKKSETSKFDIDRDNKDDFIISISNLKKDYVDLVIEDLNNLARGNQNLDDVTGSVIGNVQEDNINLNGILITIAIIIAGLLGYFLFIKKK